MYDAKMPIPHGAYDAVQGEEGWKRWVEARMGDGCFQDQKLGQSYLSDNWWGAGSCLL